MACTPVKRCSLTAGAQAGFTKGLNNMTYSNDIRYEDTLNARYEGLRIFVSDAAMRELCEYGWSTQDVVEILVNGQDAPHKRKQGIIERWLPRKNKVYVAVITKDYHKILKEDCWVLIHFGKYGK